MIVALSAEGTAAVLGAVAGGGIAIIGQALFGSFGAVRARRAAAQMIYAELTGNLASAATAVAGFGWTSTKPTGLRAAWDTYGGRLLLPWHKPHSVGAIALAYNRVDDIGWLASSDAIIEGDGYTNHILDIQTGLYVAGRAGGYSDHELQIRGVPVEAVREHLEEYRNRARASSHRLSSRWAAGLRRARVAVARPFRTLGR